MFSIGRFFIFIEISWYKNEFVSEKVCVFCWSFFVEEENLLLKCIIYYNFDLLYYY